MNFIGLIVGILHYKHGWFKSKTIDAIRRGGLPGRGFTN